MTAAVHTEGLSKTYRVGGRLWFRDRSQARTVDALRGVDLHVRAGEIFGLVGRNGYGKTTLIKCVASLLHPTRGSARVFGHDTISAARQLRRRIGWVGTEERSFYFRLTGRQNALFFAQLQGIAAADARDRVERLAAELEFTALLDRRFHEYSTGNRQRLAIIRALLHDPELLILDEPTRSLDPFAAEMLRTTLRRWAAGSRTRTVMITSHDLDEVEALGDRVGIMSRGQLRACGRVDALRRELGCHEVVGVQIGRPLDEAARQQLQRGHADLECEPAVEGKTWLRLRQRPDAPTLDGLIRDLVAGDHTIVGVERCSVTLQDIIDHVDRRERVEPENEDADP